MNRTIARELGLRSLVSITPFASFKGLFLAESSKRVV